MRSMLQKAGFNVTILENANKKELIDAVRRFGIVLRNSDAALFYFSGHGNQYNGLNWLLPIGADIRRETDMEFEGLNAERILAEMEGGSSGRVNIVIFDACRTNQSFRSFRSSNRGLAYPRVQPEGSIVAFSTAPGTIAYDGDGLNSPYVAELNKHLLTPGLKVEDVFKRVRVGVKNRTIKKPIPQIPWENSALMGDFYFVPPTDGTAISSTSSQTIDSIQPSSYRADEEAWDDIKNSSNPEDFRVFIQLFPNSQFVNIANFKLDRLKREQTEKYELTETNDQVMLVDNQKYWGGDYTGEWKNGKPHGQGTINIPDKFKYVGEFKDGKPNGQGTMTYNAPEWYGDMYEGEFMDGRFHGQGTYTHANGDKYVGRYRFGKRTGQGTLIFGPGQWHGDIYEGQFMEGKFHGQGTYTHADGKKYQGGYRDDKPNGHGIVIFGIGPYWGQKYVGEMMDGKLHGRGTYTFPDGERHVGHWKEDREWNTTQYDILGRIIGSYVSGVWQN